MSGLTLNSINTLSAYTKVNNQANAVSDKFSSNASSTPLKPLTQDTLILSNVSFKGSVVDYSKIPVGKLHESLEEACRQLIETARRTVGDDISEKKISQLFDDYRDTDLDVIKKEIRAIMSELKIRHDALGFKNQGHWFDAARNPKSAPKVFGPDGNPMVVLNSWSPKPPRFLFGLDFSILVGKTYGLKVSDFAEGGASTSTSHFASLQGLTAILQKIETEVARFSRK